MGIIVRTSLGLTLDVGIIINYSVHPWNRSRISSNNILWLIMFFWFICLGHFIVWHIFWFHQHSLISLIFCSRSLNFLSITPFICIKNIPCKKVVSASKLFYPHILCMSVNKIGRNHQFCFLSQRTIYLLALQTDEFLMLYWICLNHIGYWYGFQPFLQFFKRSSRVTGVLT